MLEYLPNEVILLVFKHLNYEDLINVSEVSKKFYEISTDPTLWEEYDISWKSLNEKMVLISLPRFKNLKSIEFSRLNMEEFYAPASLNKLLEAMP